jgi:hypothetical protein
MAGTMTMDDIARFHSKYAKSDEGGSCWNWTGTIVGRGHGQFYFGGKRHLAHRVSLKLSGADVPDGMMVCHKCNNPKCVNPSHLYVGTALDNARDSIRAGTFYFPHPGHREKHHSAKLTGEKAQLIRKLKAGGSRSRDIAVEFGVSRELVDRVCRGASWL